jgi:hypothetical protein
LHFVVRLAGGFRLGTATIGGVPLAQAVSIDAAISHTLNHSHNVTVRNGPLLTLLLIADGCHMVSIILFLRFLHDSGGCTRLLAIPCRLNYALATYITSAPHASTCHHSNYHDPACFAGKQ